MTIAIKDNMEKIMNAVPDGMDAVMITSDMNRRYYTGFASSAGVLLATREKAWFIIDSRYYTVAKEIVKNCDVILRDKQWEQIDKIIKDSGIKAVAVEEESVSAAELDRYKELVKAEISAEAGLSKIINGHRKVKSRDEIALMIEAQRIADKTFTHTLGYIKEGMSEKDIALEMEFFSRKNGSEAAAFSFIVAAGANGAVPHHVPGDYKVRRGDYIVMDFGCIIGGYCSDMTRTIAIGSVSEKQRLVYNTVLKAQMAALAAIKPGVPCVNIDKIARDIINESEFKGLFGHGLGHSLGLEVHEPPAFSPSDESNTFAGLVMSVEPGIYLPGEFGVRIEDVVAVTEDGYVNFAHSTKELTSI